MNLSINNPCTESFAKFASTEAGGFCQSCQKEVVDFTKMTEPEILHYFANRPTQTCGYFHQSQLKSYAEVVPPKRKWATNLVGTGLLSFSLFTVFPIAKGHAQTIEPFATLEVNANEREKKTTSDVKDSEFSVEGIVVDDSDEPIMGVSIIIKNTTRGMLTNEDGKFHFDGLLPGDELLFHYIGYTSKSYTVKKNGYKNLNIKLELDQCMIMGEVAVEQVYSSKRSLWKRVTSIFR